MAVWFPVPSLSCAKGMSLADYLGLFGAGFGVAGIGCLGAGLELGFELKRNFGN